MECMVGMQLPRQSYSHPALLWWYNNCVFFSNWDRNRPLLTTYKWVKHASTLNQQHELSYTAWYNVRSWWSLSSIPAILHCRCGSHKSWVESSWFEIQAKSSLLGMNKLPGKYAFSSRISRGRFSGTENDDESSIAACKSNMISLQGRKIMASIHLYFARKQVGDTPKRGKPEMRSSCRNSLDLQWSAAARPGRGSASVPHFGYLSVSRHFNE